MQYKKLETPYMLFQSGSFDNIDDMLKMKANIIESMEENKELMDTIVIDYHSDIQDGVFTFIMQAFHKFSLN